MRSRTEEWLDRAAKNPIAACTLLFVLCAALALPLAGHLAGGTPAAAAEALAVALLAWLLWSIPWALHRETVLGFLRTAANLPVVLLVIWMLVWTFAPAGPSGGEAGTRIGARLPYLLQMLAGAAVYFVVAYRIRRSEYLERFLDAVLTILAIAGVYTIYKVTTGSHAGQSPFAATLSALVPFAAAAVAMAVEPSRRLAAELVLVIVGAALLLAGGREAGLAAGCGMAVVAALAAVAALSAAKRRDRSGDLLRALAVVAAGVAMAVIPPAAHLPAAPLPVHWRAGWQLDGYGVAGVLLLSVVGLTLVIGGVRRIPRMDQGVRQMLLTGAVAAVVASAVDAWRDPSWGETGSALALWVVLGIGAGMLRPHVRSARVAPSPSVGTGVARGITLAGLAGVLCLLGLSIALQPARSGPGKTQPQPERRAAR